MTVAAKITPTELGAQVSGRFVDKYFLVKLLNSSGLAYVPGQQDSLQFVIDYEIPIASGYQPQIFGYIGADVTAYADDGVGLLQKQVIFQHDGGPNGYSFDNISVQWATGVVTGVQVDAAGANPGPLVDGDYTNLPVASNSGSGAGLAVDITVFNNAVVTMTVNARGYDYASTDDLVISSATLAAAGAHDGSGGDQGVEITSLYEATNAGSVVCIAPAANTVTLTSGNESAIYFNYKNFGYYNTSS